MLQPFRQMSMISSLKAWLAPQVVACWYRSRRRLPIWWWLLWPFTVLYRLIISLRRRWYHRHPAHPLAVPVIVVGNITVGGTGKTPLVIALANYLQQQGWRPGILLRGYGAEANTKAAPQLVTPASEARWVGDEALLLAKRCACPVVIGARRRVAAEWLLSQVSCDVLISDDGLQHAALPRDIEIVVIDGMRQFGNGFCLPLGPLREPVSRLAEADFRVCQGGDYAEAVCMQLRVVNCRSVLTDRPIAWQQLQGKSGYAVAGIGNPSRFFATLLELGLQVTAQAFPDHHAFTAADFSPFAAADYVVMTEKDAVKCRGFADKRFFYLEVAAELPPAFFATIQARLRACVASRPVLTTGSDRCNA